jgi:hypothetical protein
MPMSLTDEWIGSTRKFATRLAEQAQQINAVPKKDIAAPRGEGQALLWTLIDGLPLMPACEAMSAAHSFGAIAGKIDPAVGERLGPILDVSNRLVTLTGGGGSGPTVWAQERSGLPDLLKGIPSFFKTFSNFLYGIGLMAAIDWTGTVMGTSTSTTLGGFHALEGFSFFHPSDCRTSSRVPSLTIVSPILTFHHTTISRTAAAL